MLNKKYLFISDKHRLYITTLRAFYIPYNKYPFRHYVIFTFQTSSLHGQNFQAWAWPGLAQTKSILTLSRSDKTQLNHVQPT